MENKIQLLDCTLRDGCYIVNGEFGKSAIGGIIKRLQDAHVEIIECGWLKDMPHKFGSAYYHVPSDLEQYLIVNKAPNVKYVAMIDYNRYDLKQLPKCDGKSIDAIRVVFPKDKVDEGLALAEPIRQKGYKIYFQAANTLGYTDKEILNLIEKVNKIEPEGLSIVDTFGAMYPDDLIHLLTLFLYNLNDNIRLGLHSHNNLQLSFANAIKFSELTIKENRKIIIDASLCGMGRGAGNGCTELIAGYLNKKFEKAYDIDVILDTIDMYMGRYLNKYTWGYSTPYYISGTYCAHVNNISYLIENHKTKAKDIKNILEMLDSETRYLYKYDKLDKVYLDYQSKKINDENTKEALKNELKNKKILLIVPGKSAVNRIKDIKKFINDNNAIVIGVNAAINNYSYNYLFFSNTVRYDYAVEQGSIQKGCKVILTSNIKQTSENEYLVNYNSLVMRGWESFEISIIMILRLLYSLNINDVYIAGWDGYDSNKENYSDPNMEVKISKERLSQLNQDLTEMFVEYKNKTNVKVHFITESRFNKGDDNK